MKKFALFLTALAGGCAAQSALVRPHNPDSELEAGTVTISASAPMRWEDVVGELRPEFNSATARDYVTTAIATTQQDFSSRRSATSVQVGVDVSGETTQRTQTTETTAAGQTTTGSEVVSQNAAAPLRRADGGQVVDGTIAAPSNVFTGADRPATWPSDSTAVDPILRHRAAVALHQELVMLDNYLESAYNPCLQEAWLVRTRLVATPYARNQPLDAYSRLFVSYRTSDADNQGWRFEGIRVLPLLVTDNFERSDSRRYEQLASQVQGSLNGVSGIVAAGLGFNRYLNNLNAILGSQYNNLLTLSQIDDYTLMVRLGAVFSPTSRYEMQSRSYDITFLVVVEKDEILDQGPVSLGFFAETEMRRAETGELLPTITSSFRADLLRRLDQNSNGSDAWRRVRQAIAQGQSDIVWDDDILNLEVPDDLRTDLARWYLAASGSSTIIPVPANQVSLPALQNGVFRDSLAAGLRASVVGPPGLNANDLRAELLVDGAASAPPLTFAARSIAINRDGVIDAEFPSLGALGIDSDGRNVSLRLTRECPVLPGGIVDPRNEHTRLYSLLRNRAVLRPTAEYQASFGSVAVGRATTIMPDGAQRAGTARIQIHGIDDRSNPYIAGYEIRVQGAALRNVARFGRGTSDVSIDEVANTARVSREFGGYSLSLEQLQPSTKVRVTVVGIGTDGGVVENEQALVEFDVVAPPP